MSNMAEISISVRRFLLVTVFSSIYSKAFHRNYALSSFVTKYHNSTDVYVWVYVRIRIFAYVKVYVLSLAYESTHRRRYRRRRRIRKLNSKVERVG